MLKAQIVENFESQNISAWTQFPENRWAASSVEAIEGKFSLKHVFNNSAAGRDRISLPVENINILEGDVTWKFVLRHGFNPSSTNFWTAFLMSDKDAEMMTTGVAVNAYAIGVNLTGSNDLLYLYKISNGAVNQLINTNINWETAIKTTGKAAIEVTRKKNGEWTVRVDQTGTFDNFEIAGTPIIDTQHSVFNHFGLLFTYTTTASTRLWLDKLVITSSTLPAQILSVEKLSKTQLAVHISKSVSSIGSITLINQNRENVNIFEQTIEGQHSDKVIVTTEQLHGRRFTIAINNLTDTNNITTNTEKTFFIDNFNYGDIVFNEIMFRSEPVAGLPNRKYIELYNRTPYSIDLNGWKILYGANGESRISADSIAANSYSIICTSNAVADLQQYGKVISAVSFPSLTYAGQNLTLIDNENNVIAVADYLPDWHSNTDKTAGGWSLEKIDFNNLSELKTNWKSSNDPRGGTPGARNSVFAENADNQAPIVLEWKIIGNNTLQLLFNEPINMDIATKNHIYFVDKNIGIPVSATAAYNSVTLVFGDTIEINTVYNLFIDNMFSDLSQNTLVDFNMQFGRMYKPQNGDVIINEVLFNPYQNGVDFVEIYNRSQKNIDIKDLYLATRSKSTGQLQSIYQVSKKSGFLQPENFAVLTTNAEIVRQQYFVQNPETMIEMEKLPTYANTDGTVTLLDERENILDEFSYNEKMHFKFLTNVKGISLERKDYYAPTNDAANWHSASSDVGYATPTYKNSQAEYYSENYGFSISPQTFSPDNSGIDDELQITYNMLETGYVANIKIYDSHGRWVCNVQNNTLLGTHGSFTWNGRDSKQNIVRTGIYIVYIEYFNLQGNIIKEKKTCVVGERK